MGRRPAFFAVARRGGPLHEWPTPSHAPASLYYPSSPDGEGSLHEWPHPYEPASLYDSSSSDGEGLLHGWPTHPYVTTSSTVSSPSGEIVPVGSPPVPQGDAGSIERLRNMMEMEQRAEQYVRILSRKAAGGLAVLTIAGGVLAYYRLHNHHRRTIDPDCPTVKGYRLEN